MDHHISSEFSLPSKTSIQPSEDLQSSPAVRQQDNYSIDRILSPTSQAKSRKQQGKKSSTMEGSREDKIEEGRCEKKVSSSSASCNGIPLNLSQKLSPQNGIPPQGMLSMMSGLGHDPNPYLSMLAQRIWWSQQQQHHQDTNPSLPQAYGPMLPPMKQASAGSADLRLATQPGIKSANDHYQLANTQHHNHNHHPFHHQFQALGGGNSVVGGEGGSSHRGGISASTAMAMAAAAAAAAAMATGRSSASGMKHTISSTSHSHGHHPFSLLPQASPRGPRRQRTTFTHEQTLRLEMEYHLSEYISRTKRIQLAELLELSENQIKIWFQNRRAKDKRIEKAILEQQYRYMSGGGNGHLPGDDHMGGLIQEARQDGNYHQPASSAHHHTDSQLHDHLMSNCTTCTYTKQQFSSMQQSRHDSSPPPPMAAAQEMDDDSKSLVSLSIS